MLSLASMSIFMGAVLFSVEFLDYAFCEHNVESLCHSKKIFLTFALIMAVGISAIESLKPFGYVSVASTFIIVISFFSIAIYNMKFIVTTHIDMTDRITDFWMSKIFQFIGLAFYAAEGIALVIPVRGSFKNNKEFVRLYYSTFTFVVWAYTIMGILGYMVI